MRPPILVSTSRRYEWKIRRLIDKVKKWFEEYVQNMCALHSINNAVGSRLVDIAAANAAAVTVGLHTNQRPSDLFGPNHGTNLSVVNKMLM